MADPVGDQTGDHADQELDDKGYGSFHDVDRVDQVADRQTDRSAEPPVDRAEHQRAQDNESVSEMNRYLSARSRDRNREKCKYDVGQCCEYSGKRELLQAFAVFRRRRDGMYRICSFHIGIPSLA